MKEGKMELTFGFSEIMTNATPEVIHETFNKMNTKLQNENRPKVRIGVIIIKDNKIPLCKRKNAHGERSWCYPWVNLELSESWEKCSPREVREEVGVEIKNLCFGNITNDIFKNEQKHYITISMISDFESGEVQLMEPDNCEQWEWFEWNNYLFSCLQSTN